MGIDLDEFEMVLDARLVELQKAEKEKAEESAPKSNKYGDVRKCPVCGALVPALAGSCHECGYEFSGVDANLSSRRLAEKLEYIRKEYDDKIERINDSKQQRTLEKNRDEAIKEIIKNFPNPNTKS